ncbi:hypothetical protein CSB20_09120 [bacterium DOLZORAL124_64_63]|nr:MAG: hypothetical protein CSB20_09120 [bacterium DOLZORAL124_64_63]
MMNTKHTLRAVLALMLMLSLFLTGCASDSVAPHDEAPALSDEGVATQAAAMALVTAHVLPRMVEYSSTNKDMYSYEFSDEDVVAGTIWLDFRTGGADGAPATYSAGDWCRMHTADGEAIGFAVGLDSQIAVTLNIMADIVQATDTATVRAGSGGTFTAGAYSATFDFADVVVTAGQNYPAGGTMTFVSGARVLTVTFDGDETAVATLAGGGSWVLNLEDGSINAAG